MLQAQVQTNGGFAIQGMPFGLGVNQDNGGGTTQSGPRGFVFPPAASANAGVTTQGAPHGSGFNQDNGGGATQDAPSGSAVPLSIRMSNGTGNATSPALSFDTQKCVTFLGSNSTKEVKIDIESDN